MWVYNHMPQIWKKYLVINIGKLCPIRELQWFFITNQADFKNSMIYTDGAGGTLCIVPFGFKRCQKKDSFCRRDRALCTKYLNFFSCVLIQRTITLRYVEKFFQSSVFVYYLFVFLKSYYTSTNITMCSFCVKYLC